MMINLTQGDVWTRYYDPGEMMDMHDDPIIRAFNLESGIMLCTDCASGKTHRMVLTPSQAAAILYLLVSGNDDTENKTVQEMYEICEPVLIGCPQECRPIP